MKILLQMKPKHTYPRNCSPSANISTNSSTYSQETSIFPYIQRINERYMLFMYMYFVNKLREDPIFYHLRRYQRSVKRIFGKNGAFSRNNRRHWSRGNNHVVVLPQQHDYFQRRFSVNVWCGIFGDRLVGPLFNEAKYHALLSNEISNFLDEMPLAVLNTATPLHF
jgi:hypothetical protein